MSTTETKNEADATVPDLATQAVLMESTEMPADAPICKGYDFNAGVDLDGMMHAYKYMGFQGTNLGKAVERINEMVRASRPNEPGERGPAEHPAVDAYDRAGRVLSACLSASVAPV